MDLNEFIRENIKRCEAPNGFNHRLDDWSASDWMVATMGELGEAANIVKKLNRFRDGIPGNKHTIEELRDMLENELADTFIYLILTAAACRVNLPNAVRRVFDAKSADIGYSPK